MSHISFHLFLSSLVSRHFLFLLSSNASMLLHFFSAENSITLSSCYQPIHICSSTRIVMALLLRLFFPFLLKLFIHAYSKLHFSVWLRPMLIAGLEIPHAQSTFKAKLLDNYVFAESFPYSKADLTPGTVHISRIPSSLFSLTTSLLSSLLFSSLSSPLSYFLSCLSLLFPLPSLPLPLVLHSIRLFIH